MGYQLLLTGNKKTGVLSQVICTFVFTGESIILVHVDKQMQKELLAAKKAAMKSEGKGFIKQSVGMMKALPEYVETYHTMTEDELLKNNTMNFVIKNSQIEKITFRPKIEDYDVDNNTTKIMGKLVIKANGEKIKATHEIYDNNRAIKKYLKEVYGKTSK